MPRSWHASATSIAYSMKMTGSLYVNATLRHPRSSAASAMRVGRRGVGERVDLLRLRDVPVLAEPAREVAARGAEREHRRSREEVVQRLLLDRVDAEPARAAVGREHDLVVLAGADEAQRPAGPRAACTRVDTRRTGSGRRRGRASTSWGRSRASSFRTSGYASGDAKSVRAQPVAEVLRPSEGRGRRW